ncbi:MAG: aconitase X [Acetobacteraceae bacterium]
MPPMMLDGEAIAMQKGLFGPARRWAIAHQVAVGSYLGAADLVPVSQAHIMADTESLGTAGVEWLESLAALPEAERQVRIPTMSDPRGTDFAQAAKLGQRDWMLTLERRAIAAFEALGILMTDTCVTYQTIMPPVGGEHLAYGDTGVVIYCNSVLGARSNFEGGPSALAAALTGRTPRYGYHLDARRRGTLLVRLAFTPAALEEWGALGAIIGRLAGDYWQVPVIIGLDRPPGSDALKHFGAAMASFGSVALFHLVGVTPEAPNLAAVIDPATAPAGVITRAELRRFQAGYRSEAGQLDLVVFSAPQLSLIEMQALARLLSGRQVKRPLLAVTSPQVKPDADRLGLTAAIEAAGGTVLAGMCFYQSYARELARANGWRHLATNSAKLANIIGGYDYQPVLLSMQACVEAACRGRI